MSTAEKYFELPAIKGIQADRPYYSVMCPLGIVAKLFSYTDNTLPPSMKAQRILNKQRIPEMKNYILNNRNSYVFSSLTATVDGFVEFVSQDSNSIGCLRIGMDARILINDGQHRRAAIEEAIKEDSSLRDEDISIVIYDDLGLQRSQQIFSDLNRYAIRSTKSLNILYDNRDDFAIMLKRCIERIPVFYGRVETEKSTISNRSKALFTLSGIYNASKELIRSIDDIDRGEEIIVSFWNGALYNMHPWRLAQDNEIPPDEFRKIYVCAHTIMLKALGSFGHQILKDDHDITSWERRLSFLQTIDWCKCNSDFQGIVVVNDRIIASRNNLFAFTEYLSRKDQEYQKRG